MRRPARPQIRVNNIVAWVFLGVLVVIVILLTSSTLRTPSRQTTNSRDEEPASKEAQESPSAARPTSNEPEPTGRRQLIGKIQVLVPRLNLRAAPKKANNVVKRLKKGTILSVRAKRGSWYEVETPTGEDGFVTSDVKYIQVIEMEER